MDACQDGTLVALERQVCRHREQVFLQAVKAMRLELMLIAEQDKVRELEQREWARLEEVV